MLIKKLKAARQSAGWSQKTLAARTGVDAQTIKRSESGVGSVATLVAVMIALDFRLVGLGTFCRLKDCRRLATRYEQPG